MIQFTAASQTVEAPFHGTPAAIPGMIQVGDFDEGGEGISWHDTTPGNQGGAYRTNVDVDIYPTTNTSSGYVVQMTVGEWLNYIVDVAQTGLYDAHIRAVIAASRPAAPCHLEVDGRNVTGPIQIPTQDTAQFQIVNAYQVPLRAGRHVLRLSFDYATVCCTASDTAANFDFIRFVPALSRPLQVVAGNGIPGFADGGSQQAQFSTNLTGLDVDSSGNLYVADAGNLRVRKITPSGDVTTLAGTGVAGTNDGPALQAQFASLAGKSLTVDSVGNCYVLDADATQSKIRKLSVDRTVSTVYAETRSTDGYPYYTSITIKSSGEIDFISIPVAFTGFPSETGRLLELDSVGKLTRLLTSHGSSGPETFLEDVSAGHSTNLYDSEDYSYLGGMDPRITINLVSPSGVETPLLWHSEDWLSLGFAPDPFDNSFFLQLWDGSLLKVSAAGDPTRIATVPGANGRLCVDSQENVYSFLSNRVVKFLNYPGLTLVATTDGGGTVTIDPLGPYLTNAAVTVTETNWPGWTFLGWTNDAAGTSPALQFTMTNHLQISAVFGAPLTVTVTHATVQRNPDLAFYPYGSQVQLSLQPDLGYQFQSWSDGNTNLVRSATVTNLISLSANLSAIPLYTVSASALGGSGGSVQLDPSQGQYFQGTTVVATAVPNPGYDFQTWLDNVQVNPRTVVVASNVTLFAAFAPQAGPATVVTGPTDTNVVVGAAVLFSVAAKGAPPLQVQWQLNGTNIVGATNALLILPHAQLTDAGTYSVGVTNSSGSATASAKLQVRQAAGIRFDALTLATGGQVACTVEGPVGASFRVESSTDLKNWSTATSLQNTFGVVQFNLPLDATVTTRFYRVVQVTTP